MITVYPFSNISNFQIITLISPILQIALNPIIDCNQESKCFCAAAESSVCHKLFITNLGKANKTICFTKGYFLEEFQSEKSPGEDKLHPHANHR